MTVSLALAGCSELSWRAAGIFAVGLGVAALAGATGGGLGVGGAFDPERYDPERDANFNRQAPRPRYR